MTDSNRGNGRDRFGRFSPGCEPGPGNPHVRRMSELQSAVREALTPVELVAVLQKLRDLALDGDVHAARVLLDRCLGKPESPTHSIALDADLETVEGIKRAFAAVAGAAASGAVPADVASQVAGLLAKVAEATAFADLERRLEDLEAAR